MLGNEKKQTTDQPSAPTVSHPYMVYTITVRVHATWGSAMTVQCPDKRENKNQQHFFFRSSSGHARAHGFPPGRYCPSCPGTQDSWPWAYPGGGDRAGMGTSWDGSSTGGGGMY